MGNASSSNKSTSSGTNGSLPAWAKPGTSAYNTNNTALQTAPMGVATQTFNQGGIGNTSQNAIDQLQGMNGSNANMNSAAGGLQSGMNNYQNIYNQAGKGGAANEYLTGTAKGDYLNGSPYLEDIISKGASDTAGQVNNMFASGGRYGSVANQGALADSVTSQGNNLRNANYQAERDRQIGAANSLESAQQGRLGIQAGAAGGQTGAAGALGSLGQNQYTNNMNSQLGAAGLENQGFQNMLGMISQLPTIQGNKVFDAQQQASVGGAIDNRSQQALNDAIKQWQTGDMEDWARLGGLLQAGGQSALGYGTTNQTTTTPGNSMGLLGLLGSVLTAPMTGGGSLIGSAFGASDRRLKENIKPAGARNGHSLYEFSYKGEPERWIGVMADEVRQIDPSAVVEGDDGYLLVNYGKLGFPMKKAD